MFRVAGSNVRIPRSHKITSEFPRCATYSAAWSHSSTVIARPRFSITGLFASPTSFSNSKFCAFRVPIRMQSATSAMRPTCDTSTTSTMNGSPNRRLASCRISIPRSPRPWNEYGDVLGLNTSPRITAAPASFAARAAVIVCSSFSTAHGPAISVNASRPIGTVPILTTVVSGCRSRETILYGLPIWIT